MKNNKKDYTFGDIICWIDEAKPKNVEERMDWKEFYRHPFCTLDDVLAMSSKDFYIKLVLEVNNLKEAAILLGWFDEYYGKKPRELPEKLLTIWMDCHGGWYPDEDLKIVSWNKGRFAKTKEALDAGRI